MAVNRDPDAPIAEFADLLVVGDLFEVGPALLAAAPGAGGLSADRASRGVDDPGPADPARRVRRRSAAGLLVVFRRAGRIVARTREVEGFRAAVERPRRPASRRRSAASRADRRGPPPRSSPPTALADDPDAPPRDAVDRYVEEATALHGPDQAPTTIRADLVAELERAGRALAMVEHGATILASSAARRAASSRRRRRSSAAT